MMERVDMTSEESKIMTFKTQQDANMNNACPEAMGGQFEPSGTNGTQFDKRGSLNTLSQMTNPFRTGIYNNPANGTTLMSQSEVMVGGPHARGGSNYYGRDKL